MVSVKHISYGLRRLAALLENYGSSFQTSESPELTREAPSLTNFPAVGGLNIFVIFVSGKLQ
jgi:hypothetical protein